ncbi:hypothetical protein Aeqsu_1967 [Aequorivita sublithincola DSM 14238]|uniref:DUF4251 domain-containing protein n=1 Tax=Aequorivita sublithincola (strain DSM 14238 / LMG 21431 / ACAM 643 / 9-3) TaxID=746697 RepID=I3YWS2_AEQSU|nr:DUF4251 domain-containing protein [Aequorivita sublithincola]AFL81440.1 hypothetical protein Aeqsu_1967 [Aequorivita sublithincola DSM 14238]
MKTPSFIFAAIFGLALGTVSAQKKNLKEKPALENENSNAIESLLNSQTFEFIATTAYAISETPKSIAGSGYSVTFSPEKIVSNLPYYGRAYSGMTMGRDKGMRFKGKPEDFTVDKKNEYLVNTTVYGENDTYEISLSVNTSGYATLSISSNDRGTITYQGEVKYFSE